MASGEDSKKMEMKSARLQEKEEHLNEALMEFQATEWTRREADKDGSRWRARAAASLARWPAANLLSCRYATPFWTEQLESPYSCSMHTVLQ